MSKTDIALRVGFSSQSHLTQQFKRLTRMTAKQMHFIQAGLICSCL
ncbi:AraC family transcriptional regulator [Nostoc sp. UHCC 0926]